MVLFQRRSFLDFVGWMYSENCKERMDYGETPYPTAKAYLKKNRHFLEALYKRKVGTFISIDKKKETNDI